MSAAPPRILVVEDEPALRQLLESALREDGYEVVTRPDGEDIAQVAADFRPDLALLDVNLGPGIDGYTIARRLRSDGDVPIVFLTAAESLDDRLAGFAAGADDYVSKPFSMTELMARIRALLRRSGRLEAAGIHVGDIDIDEDGRVAKRSGSELDLTRTEFDLLLTLARNEGRVLSKSQLLSMVWEYGEYDANLVEVYVSSLRKKLEEHGPRVVHTVRGVGYVLRT